MNEAPVLPADVRSSLPVVAQVYLAYHEAQLSQQGQRLADLAAQLDQHPGNSSRPPSSDSPAALRPLSALRGAESAPDLPDGAFGPRLSALVSVPHELHPSLRETAGFLEDVMGVPIGVGSIPSLCQETNAALAAAGDAVAQAGGEDSPGQRGRNRVEAGEFAPLDLECGCG